MELLPCPFCGNKAEKIVTIIECKKCEIFMNNSEEWNTRHSPWISVGERLPNHKEIVLVYKKAGQAICVFIDSIKMNKELVTSGWPDEQVDIKKNPYYFCSQETKQHTLKGVTHWIPINEPPKD